MAAPRGTTHPVQPTRRRPDNPAGADLAIPAPASTAMRLAEEQRAQPEQPEREHNAEREHRRGFHDIPPLVTPPRGADCSNCSYLDQEVQNNPADTAGTQVARTVGVSTADVNDRIPSTPNPGGPHGHTNGNPEGGGRDQLPDPERPAGRRPGQAGLALEPATGRHL